MAGSASSRGVLMLDLAHLEGPSPVDANHWQIVGPHLRPDGPVTDDVGVRVCPDWHQRQDSSLMPEIRHQAGSRPPRTFGRLTKGPPVADTSQVTRPTRRLGSSAQTTLPDPGAQTSNNRRPGSRVPAERNPAAQPIAHPAITARQKAHRNATMMSRSATSSVTGRASAMRRMRRRNHAATASSRLFCGTNGCPSFLDVDTDTGLATCRICGYVRRVH